MEQIKELEEVLELLNTKQYTKLRQYLAELNDADIAGLLEELEEEDMLKVFRILPKDLAADVFSYLCFCKSVGKYAELEFLCHLVIIDIVFDYKIDKADNVCISALSE